MTRFWRHGFWRSSSLGNLHWVEGHWVDRDIWDRSGGGFSPLDTARAEKGFSSLWITPNARCPVCGDPVFFYQNEHGSRVFFDELGPPWPKHPCTFQFVDTDQRVVPKLRDIDESQLIREYLVDASSRAHDFASKHATLPWQPWQVDWMHRATLWDHNPIESTLFVAGSLDDHELTDYFLSLHTVKGVSKESPFVFINSEQLSYFDDDLFKPVTVPVQKLANVGIFINRLENTKW